jgi:hypothetical protein
MKKALHFPLWVHIVGLAITFFGWIAISYFFGGPKPQAKLADAVIGAFIFTVLMAIVDGITWGTMKKNR